MDRGECDGSIYYVKNGTINLVLENKFFWIYKNHNLLDVGDAKFYTIGKFYEIDDLTYIFGVSNGMWYEDDFSLKGGRLSQTDDSQNLTVIDSVYDHFYNEEMGDYEGHTYKPYYLFWDNGFKEYGAIDISMEEFQRCDGAQEVLSKIADEGWAVTAIMYRKNGIININCAEEYNFYNVTLKLEGNRVSIVDANEANDYEYEDTEVQHSSYGGTYLEARYPEIAVYPDSFPIQ